MSRVMIAEDEILSQKIFQQAIAGMGHQTVMADNGMDALHIILSRRNFDLLIADVVMPGLDGRELVRELRGHQCLRNMPVIITSGKVGPRSIGELLDEGVTFFLPKPIDVAELRSYVNTCLSRKRSSADCPVSRFAV